MNQANQDVVNQTANISLINIRQAEIDYFSNFFSSFGTQCFLLAAIIAGSVSQTPGFGADTDYFWQILYNVSAATCLALSVQALLASVFINVFGQGLAIRGPAGSMIGTINGMIAEQQSVVYLFIGAVVSFILQSIGMYFIMMDVPNAIICTIISVLFGYYTYICSMRIYNRFKLDDSRSGWNYDMNNDQEKELDELNPAVLDDLLSTASSSSKKAINKAKIEEIYRQSLDSGLIKPEDSNEKKKTVISGILKKLTPPSGKTVKIAEGSNGGSVIGGSNNNGGEASNFDDISALSDTHYTAMVDNPMITPSAVLDEERSSYLTVKTIPFNKKMLVKRETWIRYYFVLRGHYIYYYEDRKAFTQNASKPINLRPIDLEGYSLIIGRAEVPYAFSLVPVAADDIRKTWRFRCDTINEYNRWISMIQKAIPGIPTAMDDMLHKKE